MSTLLENKVFSTENILYSKFFVVQKELLGDAVKRIRNDKNLSLADVRAKSRKKLATSYISRIENNQVSPDSISLGKIQALAKGLGETDEYIIALALEKKPNQEIIFNERFAAIAVGYVDLTEQARRNLEPLVAGIELAIERNGAARDGDKPKVLIAGTSAGKKTKTITTRSGETFPLIQGKKPEKD